MEGFLVKAKEEGRYTIGESGPLLLNNQRIHVKLDGLWLSGWVEFVVCYDTPRKEGKNIPGNYVFFSQAGGRCGLCQGMQVRTIEDPKESH